MYQEERLYEILNILREKTVLSNKEIMETFNISRDTARRDIVRLVEEGVAIRTHGGIAVPSIRTEIKDYKSRLSINSEEKIKLGKYAAKYVSTNQACFFDVSTTIEALCQCVEDDISIYTHSLDNMEILAEKNCDVHLLGGKLQRKNRFLYGSGTINQIEDIHFDIAFLGAAAISEDGIYVVDFEDSYIKRKVAERSTFVCVIADGEKFFNSSTFKAISFDRIDLLITTKEPPENIEKRMKDSGTVIEIV
ncbi:DeoR/GlpR family DNA-binding transcription regulator [Clostridium beijerinckii]|uniref:DeoR/GlpR family transcriptional regulator of sugar metabolism n=1 Tax=Clostridium beijerinckii TaxID=1520 RepID=A0A9Q5CN83_CLOBE|nr:DeoR/GlpR family DNA-binding transcription regulator [Clostridium beijerinckii]AQS05208.1 HTH-type transcriptional repressor GlcR [Clostridium beijerinckii]MBA2887030.1 DeoR/GlpR family transcriptional regulator of sugar metabolism [Clostridium beijerinckii]MBA2901766.1 DeoR/GlpR family transcriptional regulator of sugar metabolism [Clostridium beijerinckii]MBA2911710.1 DeoR/GlpR family transcriptional regulator of sugar metabolism [Clostridium beijerinckii]MBA9015220.1 DeoR/GlpR family tra